MFCFCFRSIRFIFIPVTFVSFSIGNTNIKLGMKKVIGLLNRLLSRFGKCDPMIWGYVMLH